MLVLLGRQDGTVFPGETAEDAIEAFGKDNVEVLKLRGGHDLPIVNSEGCAKAMMDFWATA